MSLSNFWYSTDGSEESRDIEFEGGRGGKVKDKSKEEIQGDPSRQQERLDLNDH